MPDNQRQAETQGMPSIEEMQSAIEGSGYLLEGRISRVMTEHGFLVLPNKFYTISAGEDSAIEIDAEGRISELIDEENGDMVSAVILAECKNNSQPFAFFSQRQQFPSTNAARIRYSGYPSFSMDQETKLQVPLHELLEMNNWHHYTQRLDVATQFCSFARANEKKPWKAEPMDHYAGSFSRLAMVAASPGDAFDLSAKNIQVHVCYPVVVFQGPIYIVRDNDGKAAINATEHIQVHHSALLNGRLVSVQIDAVTESGFARLVALILDELRTCRDKMKALYPRLLTSARDQKRVAYENAARIDFQRWYRGG